MNRRSFMRNGADEGITDVTVPARPLECRRPRLTHSTTVPGLSPLSATCPKGADAIAHADARVICAGARMGGSLLNGAV